jgi:hypothetical protein
MEKNVQKLPALPTPVNSQYLPAPPASTNCQILATRTHVRNLHNYQTSPQQRTNVRTPQSWALHHSRV